MDTADPPSPGVLEKEADAAMAAGDRARARTLLERLAETGGGSIDAWLKLAAICRAEGRYDAALQAVSGALRLEPLGFVPLLLKGSLLEAANRPDEAGETYGFAIAQQPESVPPHLHPPLARAREVHAQWRERQKSGLAAAVARHEAMLSQTERKRVERFVSNAIRDTKVWHAEPTHFHYPGLSEREFHDRDLFPWLPELEAATEQIRAEFDALLASERAETAPYIQYPEDQPLRQWKSLNWNRDWTAIHLLVNGEAVPANARHCPQTLALLERIGQPRIKGRSPNAMFSLLAPGTHIPPHHGVANTRLVCHLPLTVPDGCWFRVGAERREWRPGEAFVFDDTIEHEAMNGSDRLRVVLIFDVWHPGLSPAERDAVAALIPASAAGAGDL